jgi:hypothetical protein
MLRRVRKYSVRPASVTLGVLLPFAASTIGTKRIVSGGTVAVTSGCVPVRGKTSLDGTSSAATPRGSRTTCHVRPAASRALGTRNCTLGERYVGDASSARRVVTVSL